MGAALTRRFPVDQSPAPFDVYYLSVGSGDYVAGSTGKAAGTLRGLTEVDGATRSARRVAHALRAAASVYGVTLLSGPGHFVTRNDILKQLHVVIGAASANHSGNPLIVYYFVGHGVSEGLGWNHFLLPGDFTFSDAVADLQVNNLAARAVPSSEVVDSLEKSGASFLVLFDDCQSGRARSLESSFLSANAAQSGQSALTVVKYLNQFHLPNPVVFATRPGSEAFTKSDPMNPQLSVGPLARRLLIVYDSAQRSGRRINLSTLVAKLTDPAFDRGQSDPGITFVNLGRDGSMFRVAPAKGSEHLLRNGTGGAPVDTPSGGHSTRLPNGADPSVMERRRGSVSFSYVSPPGEFVGSGQDTTVANQRASLITHADGAISITVPLGDLSWELTFAPPAGRRLVVGTYNARARYLDQDADEPALDIAGPGRGCNTLSGSFSVAEVKYDRHGIPIRIDATFSQACDGGPILTGRLMYDGLE
jgi:hypothetical protein